jgi:hypothetical protein
VLEESERREGANVSGTTVRKTEHVRIASIKEHNSRIGEGTSNVLPLRSRSIEREASGRRGRLRLTYPVIRTVPIAIVCCDAAFARDFCVEEAWKMKVQTVREGKLKEDRKGSTRLDGDQWLIARDSSAFRDGGAKLRWVAPHHQPTIDPWYRPYQSGTCERRCVSPQPATRRPSRSGRCVPSSPCWPGQFNDVASIAR